MRDCPRNGRRLADATAVGPDIVSAPVQTSSPLVQATPIVFVVDDDVGMRESLVSLISGSGWRPETFASAQDRALGLVFPSIDTSFRLPYLSMPQTQCVKKARLARCRRDSP